jgi:hypothetical protein
MCNPHGILKPHFANFCAILAHERQHANNQVNGGHADGDNDLDRLTADFEDGTSLTLDSDPWSSDPEGVFGDHNAITTDREVYAGGPVEDAAIAGVDNSKDWASPGRNWGQ